MSTNLQVAGRREKQWKADCIYVQFVYNLCTIFRIISYNYQRVTASNMYNCLQAYFFGVFTKSKTETIACFLPPGQLSRPYLLANFILRRFFYLQSLQGKHILPARRTSYPCKEKTLSLQGENATLAGRAGDRCNEVNKQRLGRG